MLPLFRDWHVRESLKKVLYIDCFSGVAGDMMLGALLDLGVSLDHVVSTLEGLGLARWRISVTKGVVQGIAGTDVHVFVNGQQERTPHHDVWGGIPSAGPDVLSPETKSGAKGRRGVSDTPLIFRDAAARHAFVLPRYPIDRRGHRDDEHPHPHTDHSHHHHHQEGGIDSLHAGSSKGHSAPHQHGRTFPEIRNLLQQSNLPDKVRHLAIRTFTLLAEAEAHVHGTNPDEVHFHEVGAVDAIIDIVGAATALVALDPDEVVCARPPLGRGFVQCQHGRFPLPSPAVLELLRGVPTVGTRLEAELVTPTGAALVRAFSTRFGDFPPMTIERIGIGLGDARWPDRPNVLRLVVGSQDIGDTQEWIVEANIDDMSPEWVPPLLQSLLDAGAKDVWCTPTLMKKGRPGFVVSAIIDEQSRFTVTNTLFRESTTIGLRTYPVNRTKLRRENVSVVTDLGPVSIKLAFDGQRIVNAAPELETCLAVARNAGVGLPDVFRLAMLALQRDFPVELNHTVLFEEGV